MPPPGTTERGLADFPEVCPPAFTGRDRESATLAEALAEESPTVVLIEGEAGIGKTRLLREYLAAAQDGERKALVATCPPLARPQTMGPVTEAARQAAAAGVRGLRLSPLAGALRPLFPEWADDLPPAPEPAEDSSAARYRVFAAMAELLARLGTGLLAVEDAHWADEATLEFLLYLASRQPRPLSLVVTCRPEETPGGSLLPRLSRLAAGGTGRQIGLGPLDAAAAASLVSSMLAGQPVSAEFAGFLHQQSDGVPLAVEELVRLMADRGDLARDDTGWLRRPLAEITVPASIRTAVRERAGRLSPDAQTVLRAAAVLTDPAPEAAVQSVAGLPAERLRAGLSQALASGLLAEERRGLISFRHALGCRAVYEEVPGPDRRALHRRAGEALEDIMPCPAAQLTRHFREAGDCGKWCEYAERAGDLALAAGDEATAAVLLHELITGAVLPAQDVARLAGKMVLLALPGDDWLASLAAALRRVLGTGDLGPALEAGLRFQLGRTLFTMQDSEASRTELERAVAGLPPDSLQAVRAMMLLGWPRDHSRRAAEHLRWLHRAAASAASVPPAERLRLLVDRVTVLLALGEQAGWSEAESVPWETAEPRDRLQVIRAHENIGEAAVLWGRYAEARCRLEHAAALADVHHHARLRAMVLVTLVHLDWFTGAWAGLAERAAALAGDDDVPAPTRLQAIQVIGLLRAAAGDPEQACQDLSYVASAASRHGAIESVPESAAALARLYLDRGDVTAALTATDEPIGIVVGKGTWLWAADLAPARVTALAAAGRLDEAAALTGALAGGLRGRDIPMADASLVLCRAIVVEARGEQSRAAAGYARAASAWQALPRPYDALLARERQARCLLAAGQGDAGLDLLTELRQQFLALGAVGDADRVVCVLREHGIAARMPQRGGNRGYGERLSPRELEAVHLVAQGRTDREIAQSMVISPKTVARHLDSARRKLSAPSRTALAVTALAAGLVSAGPAADSP